MKRTDRKRVAEAIAAAEAGTTGLIAVRVIPDAKLDPFERAKAEFGAHGLHRHPDANAALILVAPRAKRFAVLGDRALHERVGETFWTQVVEEARPYFAREDIPGGVLAAVHRLGVALHAHFPTPSAP